MSPEVLAAAQAGGLSQDDLRRVLETLRGMTMFRHIEPSARIGEGSKVWHFAVILQDVEIGQDCSVGSGCEIGRGTVIGDRSRIGAHVFLPPHSLIGSNVFIGPGVHFADDRYPKVPMPGDAPYKAEPPVVEDDAVIGLGCVILPGVHIGRGAMIGAGAVVTRSVGPGEHVRGEPARTRTFSAATAPHYMTGVVT